MKLAADADVLLSAVLGGRAKRILRRPKVEEAVTAEATFAEEALVRGHCPAGSDYAAG